MQNHLEIDANQTFILEKPRRTKPHGHVVHATATKVLEPLNNKKHQGLEQREQKPSLQEK